MNDALGIRSPLALLALLTFACGSKEAPAPAAAAPAEPPPAAAAPPAPAAPAPAPAAPADPSEVRCGDLISGDEIQELGIDASGFRSDKTAPRPGMGVNCLLSTVSLTLFAGDGYDTMVEGWRTNGGKAGVRAADGPTIGGAAQWTATASTPPVHSVMFRSSNGRFAANVSGMDKALVEKLARALAANMERR